MKKIRMCFPNEKTFQEGFEEYILDCKARNLRDGTINHYRESITRSSNYHALWDYCHERGLEQTGVHRFRHTFAKKWATMGGSVVVLQKILGHSSLAITEGYLNLLTSDLKKEMDEVNIIRSLKQEHIRMRA